MSGGSERWREAEPDELARHQRTAAVAQRTALTEATILIDALAAQVAKRNPGRRRGTLSIEGRKLHDAMKLCADAIDALRGVIDVPGKEGPVYVPSSVFDRSILEAEVERQVPGAYPHRAVKSPTLSPGEPHDHP